LLTVHKIATANCHPTKAFAIQFLLDFKKSLHLQQALRQSERQTHDGAIESLARHGSSIEGSFLFRSSKNNSSPYQKLRCSIRENNLQRSSIKS
jgi:hypothetical protein